MTEKNNQTIWDYSLRHTLCVNFSTHGSVEIS